MASDTEGGVPQAFNAHVYDPENLKPGDVVNVGRHHKIRGPCINFFTRQVH